MSSHIIRDEQLDEALERKDPVFYANYIEYVTNQTRSYYQACLVQNIISVDFNNYTIDVNQHCNAKYFYGITVKHVPNRKDIWLRQLRRLDE